MSYQTVENIIREALTDFADSRRTSVEINHYASEAARKICARFRGDLDRLSDSDK